jgi:hypothetical protein
LGDFSKISQTQLEKWKGLVHPIPSHIEGPDSNQEISWPLLGCVEVFYLEEAITNPEKAELPLYLINSNGK